jgi:hypothetical protein
MLQLRYSRQDKQHDWSLQQSKIHYGNQKSTIDYIRDEENPKNQRKLLERARESV